MTAGAGAGPLDRSGPALLSVRGLTVTFGGVRAVSDVDLEVGAGELVGLIGPNGAGKTTTIDAICGFVPHQGTVELEGRDLSGVPPHTRARAGIARTWQSIELFADLTLAQNCEVAATRAGLGALAWDLVGRRRGRQRGVEDALAAVGLASQADRLPTELSLGHQKLAGVARALAASPRVLLLDEPAAGLDTTESLDLGRRLRSLIDTEGLGGLLIDHDTALVFEVCDRVVVLDFGAVIAAGPADAIRADPRVIEAYLGVTPDGGDR